MESEDLKRDDVRWGDGMAVVTDGRRGCDSEVLARQEMKIGVGRTSTTGLKEVMVVVSGIKRGVVKTRSLIYVLMYTFF